MVDHCPLSSPPSQHARLPVDAYELRPITLKLPRFRAHLVTCDRCAARSGRERSTQPRLLPGSAVQTVHKRGGVVQVHPRGGGVFAVGQRAHSRPLRHGESSRNARSCTGRWWYRPARREGITDSWIERTYHRRRRQATLGRSTPIEFEAIMTTPASRTRPRAHRRGPLPRRRGPRPDVV
jgi:hypothetical protein